MRRIILLTLLLILTSLACSLGTAPPTPTQPPAPVPPTNTAAAPVTQGPQEATEAAGSEPTAEPGTASLPPEIEMQMNAIQRQVIDVRGLQPSGEVPRALLSPEALRQRVIDDFLADYTEEEVAEDVIVLAAFGLLEPNFDLRTFYIDLLSEQIAGFYDNEAGEMYVVQGEGFFGPERLTYSHEYTHVLQDQNYDFEDGLNYNDESCEEDTERCAAVQSLIEGDASLTELNWFYENATADDQAQIMDFFQSYSSPVYDSAPAFMQQDFVFAYNYGLTFVQALYDEGGWEAVDAAYANVPISTEQILHPERYPADRPVPVNLPDLLPALGAGWRELDRNVMGEWYTYLILGYGIDPATQIEDEIAADAAAGWEGDTYLVYYKDADAQTVVVMRTLWESPTDATQFSNAFHDYAEARFDTNTLGTDEVMLWHFPGGYATLLQSGAQTTWVLAPDETNAQLVLEAIGQ